MNADRRQAAKAALQAQVPAIDWPGQLIIAWVDTLLQQAVDEVDSPVEPDSVATEIVDGTHLLVDVASAFSVVAEHPTLAWQDLQLGDASNPAEAVFDVFRYIGHNIVVAELERLRASA